jgi:hypothetical protein
MQAPGETLFTAICANCHGPDADSKGRQAATVATLTGGNTRVANFRDGLFGPVTSPGAHLNAEFTATAADDTAQDVAARYMVFMGLGGTQRQIPSAVLSIVRNTAVLGVARSHSAAVASANMLETSVGMCSQVLGVAKMTAPLDFTESYYSLGEGRLTYTNASPITSNGDAEMWEELCSIDNPGPVTMFSFPTAADAVQSFLQVAALYSYRDSDGLNIYPAAAFVGNADFEVVQGIQEGNLHPWCFRGSEADLEGLRVRVDFFTAQRAPLLAIPVDTRTPKQKSDLAIFETVLKRLDLLSKAVCPEELTRTFANERDEIFQWQLADARRWATRGAVNAGFSVFTYLNAYFVDHLPRKPLFTACDEL